MGEAEIKQPDEGERPSDEASDQASDQAPRAEDGPAGQAEVRHLEGQPAEAEERPSEAERRLSGNSLAEGGHWPEPPAPERRERNDRRAGDRRSQDRRLQVRRHGEATEGMASSGNARRKALVVPYVAAAALIGLVAGFALSRMLDFGTVRLKESAFGLDASHKIARGRPFDGKKEMRRWSDADRASYSSALDALRAGHPAQAAEALAALRKTHPEYPLPHALAAYSLVLAAAGAGGDLIAAQAAYRAALSADSAHPFARYAAGRVCEALNLPDSAEAHYARAMRLSPQFAYPYVGLGRVHSQRGESRLASLNFRAAIGLLESDPAAYPESGRAGGGKAEGDARADRESALPAAEHEPIDLLATLYYQSGAEDSARMALEYGEERGIKTGQMALVQGWLWEGRGFLAKADSLYRSLQAQDPGNPAYREAIATLGWKPIGHGSSKSQDADAAFALSLLDPLARQHPQNAPLWMALGEAYYRRGLYGMATEAFDSCLRYDAVLPGLAEKRDAAYQALLRQAPVKGGAPAARPSGLSPEEQTPVIIPGSIALLGNYSVPWGSTPTEVRQAYPKKDFRTLPNGNLLDVFVSDGVRHEYLLAFKEGKLWGVRAYVTDSAGVAGDLFGRIIRTKVKISGEGKGTGEAKCNGFHSFQGAIWENDDTFEFMAQFQGEENRVRLARLGRDYLPQNRRLCDLVVFLRDDTWK
jgi:tetratricopeptide (TPR) repeat protein